MLIWIISDVHENLKNLHKAIQVFNEKKIELLLHCWDWDMPFTLSMYKQFNCPIKWVLGNADTDIQRFYYQMQNFYSDLDLEITQTFLDLELDGKRVGIFHGDDENLNKLIIETQKFDVFCSGHTHRPKIEKIGKTLLINPGTLVDMKYIDSDTPISVAIYDTETDIAEIIEL